MRSTNRSCFEPRGEQQTTVWIDKTHWRFFIVYVCARSNVTHSWGAVGIGGQPKMNQSQHRRDKSNQKRKKRTPRNLHCVVHFLDKSALLFRCNASYPFRFFARRSSNSKLLFFLLGQRWRQMLDGASDPAVWPSRTTLFWPPVCCRPVHLFLVGSRQIPVPST